MCQYSSSFFLSNCGCAIFNCVGHLAKSYGSEKCDVLSCKQSTLYVACAQENGLCNRKHIIKIDNGIYAMRPKIF